jgi:hypothetical protein
MQTRIAFNSGEFSPEMAYRSDMDQHGRACETLENWEVSQMGGLKRRHGMRYLTDALSAESRLIPYIYSYAPDSNQRFLVELSEQVVRVLDYDGNEVQAKFTLRWTGPALVSQDTSQEKPYHLRNKNFNSEVNGSILLIDTRASVEGRTVTLSTPFLPKVS